MGAAGALIISAGSVISMTGNNMGQVLTGSRMLFALAENGALPKFLATIHQRYRTPSHAIIVTTAVALGLALSGSFAVLAVASAVARLITYAGVCAATLWLRRSRFQGVVAPATFVIPLGALVPLLAIGASLLILAGATRQQLLGGAAALAAGAAVFIANARFGRSSLSVPTGS
jgi:APA family basic amino acid/polyamine antiporter